MHASLELMDFGTCSSYIWHNLDGWPAATLRVHTLYLCYLCTKSTCQECQHCDYSMYHVLLLMSTASTAGVDLVLLSSDTSLPERDTALLACIGYGEPEATISWVRNGMAVRNTSLVNITEAVSTAGGRTFKHSYLQICSVEIEDAGVYVCDVFNGRVSVSSSVQLIGETYACTALLS